MDEDSVTTSMNFNSLAQLQEDFTNMTFNPGFHTAFSDLFYRNMFIVFYGIIFIVCIVGNTLVLIVTANSVRMKTRTNFFLANLAAADLCVGILCILPNLHLFLYFRWLLGKTMCKVYYFAENFSLCVSVLLLTVIAVERYIAVMHPLRVKTLFTNCRMQTAQISIWVFAAVYNIPLVAIFDTFEMPNGTVYCNIRDGVINLKLYFTINFLLWYTLPLVTMSVAYAIISWTLWHSGTIFNQQRANEAKNYYSSIKMASMSREHRLSENVSSSSSGASGSATESNVRENNGNVDCSLCRHGNGSIGGNLCDVNDRFYIHYANDTPDRVHLNGDDKSVRCGLGATNFTGTKSEMFVSGHNANHIPEYSAPVCWSWPAREDAGRDGAVRSFRNTTCAGRISGNNISNVETNGLTSTCLVYQKTHSKRQNGVINQTMPIPNTKLQPNRHSFHSDYASDSSAGCSPAYDIHKCQPSTSQRVLSSRRKVVKLLVLILLTFAVCVLPQHIRLLMFYWNVYPEASFGLSFFPPLAFLSLYLNSALNPVLYSLFSVSFRRSLRECFRRPWHRGKSYLSKYILLCYRRSRHHSHEMVDMANISHDIVGRAMD